MAKCPAQTKEETGVEYSIRRDILEKEGRRRRKQNRRHRDALNGMPRDNKIKKKKNIFDRIFRR